MGLQSGAVLHTNAGKKTLAFTEGAQQIIPGLDKALLGKKAGESKTVTVKPEDAYGAVGLSPLMPQIWGRHPHLPAS